MSESPAPTPHDPPPQVRAIVVDEDEYSAKLLSFLLYDEGCDVRIAPTAEAGLRMAKAFLPQLVVLEPVLHGMSGVTLARELKSISGSQDIVVIAVTVSRSLSTAKAALDAGCSACTQKPVDVALFGRWALGFLNRVP